MKRELVSVIMPVYNAEDHIRESIESVLNQTYSNFEFIIIDDGSTDSSLEIIKQYNDERIKVLEQDNRGVAISLNKGISISKGTLIARQDSDDISLPNRFEKQCEFMNANPNISLLGTYSQLIDEENNVIKSYTAPSENNKLRDLTFKKNPFIHGSVMIRKEILKKCGLYREQFLLSQDYDLWLRISEVGEISMLPDFLYKYRIWKNSVSSTKTALKRKFDDIARELAKERRKHGYDLLMKGNNYFFYESYGREIISSLNTKELRMF